MNIKKGDNVIVMTGKDKGKTGTVVRAFPKLSTLIVEGINKHKKHQRPRKEGEKGQTVEKSFPMHASNVMIVDKKSGKGTRVGSKMVGEKKVRIARKSGQEI
ncbi:MAG: 50S ribosomal protein L24 [Candidatus Pacebacteria bacterium]|nr:50S ribosomal protein L24 [Candidatus Paceibacterota bacterium]